MVKMDVVVNVGLFLAF